MHPRPLVGSVDVGLALRHNLASLVRSVYVLAAHGKLPSMLHAASRTHYPVVAVALVQLGSLGGVVKLTAVEDDARLAYSLGAVGRQFADGKYRVESCAAARPSVYKVALAVLVPHGAGVYHTLASQHTHRAVPLAAWVLGLNHKDAVVGVAPVDVQLAVVVPYGRRPHTIAVLRQVEERLGFLFLQGIAYDLPINQIVAMQNGQARNTVERACR